MPSAADPKPEERRVEFVFNFDGSKHDWTDAKIQGVVERLKEAIDDEQVTLVRVDKGSVRLVLSVRENDLSKIDIAKLRGAVEAEGVSLLGGALSEEIPEADTAKAALASSSADLLAWEKTLPNGRWIERPERLDIEGRFHSESSSTVLLGEPGSGKSALLSQIAADLFEEGKTVFALKADFLPTDVGTEADLQRELELPAPTSDLILRLAKLQPVYVIIDQLDALASQLDLRSGRLNVLLNLVRRVGGCANVHILLSARTFEFNHDVRLRAVQAEAVNLELPPWHEVKDQLGAVGIDPDTWPEKARDVVRIPQALKTFIGLVGTGRTEPFTTYQAMLEQLWNERIAAAADSQGLIALASGLASQMADEEALWLAAARYDDRLSLLNRLVALGFVVRSENNLSVAFSHQTVFDYVLARTFVRNSGLLSTYVLERQDSLFVRAKVWSALNYLRGAEVRSYERELLAIWSTTDLRRHLRLLLIEFLGQVREPLEFEKTCMAEVLGTPDLRILGLKAIASSLDWFPVFASTAIREAMHGNDAEMQQAARLLSLSWATESSRVIQLTRDRWLGYPERDYHSWMVLTDCPIWTNEVEELATAILRRSAISLWSVDHTASILAVDQPAVAARLVRAKLDYLMAEALVQPAEPPLGPDASDADRAVWHMQHRETKPFEKVLDAQEWDHLSPLAEAAPADYLEHLWPWYVGIFSRLVAHADPGIAHVYPGQYVVEFEFAPPVSRSPVHERPLMSAIQDAVEAIATKQPDAFCEWADQNSKLAILAVQQLIARGFQCAADLEGVKGAGLAAGRPTPVPTRNGSWSATDDARPSRGLRAAMVYGRSCAV